MFSFVHLCAALAVFFLYRFRLFVLLLDGLHDGLHTNPFTGMQHGLRLTLDHPAPPIYLPSLGYADDTDNIGFNLHIQILARTLFKQPWTKVPSIELSLPAQCYVALSLRNS